MFIIAKNGNYINFDIMHDSIILNFNAIRVASGYYTDKNYMFHNMELNICVSSDFDKKHMAQIHRMTKTTDDLSRDKYDFIKEGKKFIKDLLEYINNKPGTLFLDMEEYLQKEEK